jgi:hypothetical protein
MTYTPIDITLRPSIFTGWRQVDLIYIPFATYAFLKSIDYGPVASGPAIAIIGVNIAIAVRTNTIRATLIDSNSFFTSLTSFLKHFLREIIREGSIEASSQGLLFHLLYGSRFRCCPSLIYLIYLS